MMIRQMILVACTVFLIAGCALNPMSPPLSDAEEAEQAFLDKDYKNALKLWLKAAEDNDPIMQKNVGIMYERGLGTEKDHKTARRWYKKAADQGYGEAAYLLADMMVHGRGGPLDYLGAQKLFVEAARWFFDRAQEGDKSAMMTLYRMHMAGDGVTQDDDVAKQWLLASRTGEMPDYPRPSQTETPESFYRK